ncbi:sigma 54-interacting transcriptional regulator [Rubrivivax sp. JA1026]|uniref:sigma 54-interacting transcriptional regulator n=1 Tax=Rubrivivax sp. JA1026 TaxID=2710888 RepID=UPI0013E93F7D|nr:sigma 54-interacting transcriptional regulator [Rubrivivax sp. JA1026]
MFNLLVPRLILVGGGRATECLESGVWLHRVSVPEEGQILSKWLEDAQAAEWAQVAQRHSSTIKAVRSRSDVDSPVRGTTWSRLVDQYLSTSPAQLVSQPTQATVEGLAPLVRIAREVVGRPSVITFLAAENRSSRGGTPPRLSELAQEVAQSAGLLNSNVVSFMRLRRRPSSQAAAHDYDNDPERAFECLMHELMSKRASVTADDYTPKEGPRLIEGVTGSGKTEFARSLHQRLLQDTERRGAFHAVNIAAVKTELLESRLRGYNKGAFTGAVVDQPGWFELADGGTLFLDEIQSAPIDFQVQLLDLLSPVSDTLEIERIGAKNSEKKRCRVRVVMATNEPVQKLLHEGRIREDFLYRIRSTLRLESLSQRLLAGAGGELVMWLLRLHRWRSAEPVLMSGGRIIESDLVDRLRRSFLPAIPDEVIDILRSYSWPGNLREFERVSFDVFLEYDRGTKLADLVDSVRRAMGTHEAKSTWQAHQREGDQIMIVRKIESLLVANDFNVSATQDGLAVYKKRSPAALKRFLRENLAHLDMSKWTSQKAKKLLRTL